MNNLDLALVLWSFVIGWLIGIFMGQINGVKEVLNSMKEIISEDKVNKDE